MNILKPVEAAYIAGLVDGEGCIGAYHREGIRYNRKCPYYFDFSVTNTNKELADHFIRKCGIGQIRLQGGDKAHHKPRHCFVLRKRQDILDFLKEIVDYMVLKKPQALVMIRLASSRLSKRPHSPYDIDEENMISELRRLNKKGLEVSTNL